MIWLVTKVTGLFILVFAKCIILSLDFQIESELVWFNFRGNGTSFLAGKTKQKRIKSSSICDHKGAIVGVE